MSNSSVALEHPIIIGIATTLKEKREIYRLRYRIYIEEMAMYITSADHDNNLLYDDLDKWGILLYAKSGSELIGTIRVNIGQQSEFPPDLSQFLSLKRFQKFYRENNQQIFAYSSKLMVAPHCRNSYGTISTYCKSLLTWL